MFANSFPNFIFKFGSEGTGDGQFPTNYGPYGLALDSSGNVLVADVAGSRIQIFDSSGNFISTFGSAGSGDGQLKNPQDLAVDSSGNIYVADTNNDRIQKFDSSWNFLLKFGNFELPTGITIDNSGNILVADFNKDQIQKFDSSGNLLLTFGSAGSGDGQFNSPSHVAVDSLNNIYVTDNDNFRVQKFDTDGNFILEFGSEGTSNAQFTNPIGIAIDDSDSIYVTDNHNENVQIFDSSGNFLLKFGSEGSNDGQFKDIHSIVFDNNGDLYISENRNYRIQFFSFSSPPPEPEPDTIPPVIVVPNDMAIQATSSNPSPVTFSVSATDDTDGNLTPACSPASGSNFPIGITTVTCTAIDASRNSASESFTVTVTEPESEPEPEPSSQSLDVEINSVTKISENKFQIEVINHKNYPIGGVQIWAATYEGNTILESLTGVFDYLPAFESAQGIIQFTKIGDDIDVNLLGFHSTAPRNDFSVTKFIQGESFIHPNVPAPEPEPEPEPEPPPPGDDTIPPELLMPSDMIITGNDLDGIAVTYSVKAIDNFDQILTPECDPPSGSIFPLEVTIVRCSVTDSSGNTDTDSFKVLVKFSEFVVPEWVKDVAGFWCNDEIDDAAFVQAIQYLITSEILIVPSTESEEDGSEKSNEIPAWIKNNACWWSQGAITDGDFVNGLQYLIGQGIIRI